MVRQSAKPAKRARDSSWPNEPPSLQRLEIELPLRENPDKYGNRKHQPEYKFRRTEAEIKREFQGYRFDKNPSEGNCKNPHGKWEDDLVVRIYVVATFDEARMKWVRQMKRRLERRFKQWEIYVTFSPIKEI